MATERRSWRQFGRILVGIGLLILSLEMIGEASEPLRESRLLPVIVEYFSTDPVTAYLLAAFITWLFHSSIAAVLLLVTLAGRGFIPPELGVVLVLASISAARSSRRSSTRHAEPGVRVVPIGNLLMRGAGSLILMIAFTWAKPPVAYLGSTVPDQIINAHILFNCLILIAGIPLAGLIYRVSEKIVAFGHAARSRRIARRCRTQRSQRKRARHAISGARQRNPRGGACVRDGRDHVEAHYRTLRESRCREDRRTGRARRPRRQEASSDKTLSGQDQRAPAHRGRKHCITRN